MYSVTTVPDIVKAEVIIIIVIIIFNTIMPLCSNPNITVRINCYQSLTPNVN